ncbi:MAG: isoprenylcysteine carboxylmethyltransferase family protein [Pseudomonadota bacterium]
MRILNLIDLPPIWTAVTIAACWGISRYSAPLPDSMRYSGWLLIAVAVLLAVWAVQHLHRAGTAVMPKRTPRALVRTGPYRFSRNPIYVADLLAVVGAAFAFGQPAGAVLAPMLGLVLYVRFIRSEEACLAERFEHMYDAWRAEIPRWI